MRDYEPVDISAHCNVGASFLCGRVKDPLIGRQSFHGLPFIIGSEPPSADRCLIGVGAADGSREPITLPIGRAARYLIFLHTLLESRTEEGEPIGNEVAAYQVKLADGTSHRLPIRERFEVAPVPTGWGQFPFLSLPEQSADAYLDGRRGWGEAQNMKSSPAYVEVAARPSATVTVKSRGREMGRANWGELQEKGGIETERVHFKVADTGRNWVHVKVVDDETGRPVHCRVHFRSPEGIPYQPHGHHNQVNRNLDSWHQDIGGDLRLGQIGYAYIDGTCQGWLPRGEVIADVARGFEYEPLRTKVQIKPGQRQLELRLKRWVHMNERGWYSGDSHVHFLGTQGAHREAQGEDLNVVNLLASQWGHLFTNTEDFIGRPTVSDDGKTIVYCAQENRQHLLGHLTLWGLKEHVSPWCSDGPSEAELGGNLEITMSRWADACHAQGGTVIIPHLPTPNGSPAALIATGRADAVEMLRQGGYEHHEYYRYLNCGYKLPLVGGTDKMSSDVPVGLYRKYAHLPDDMPFDYQTWCDAVKAGRTFQSGGPIIDMKVNGAPIGDTIKLPGNGGTVEVEAWAESIFPLNTLQIVQEGRVVASTDEARGSRKLHLTAKLKIEKHSWLAARCGGPDYDKLHHHDCWSRGIFAHTSPVYLAVGGDWWMFDSEAAQSVDCSDHIFSPRRLYIDDRVRHEQDLQSTHGESPRGGQDAGCWMQDTRCLMLDAGYVNESSVFVNQTGTPRNQDKHCFGSQARQTDGRLSRGTRQIMQMHRVC